MRHRHLPKDTKPIAEAKPKPKPKPKLELRVTKPKPKAKPALTKPVPKPKAVLAKPKLVKPLPKPKPKLEQRVVKPVPTLTQVPLTQEPEWLAFIQSIPSDEPVYLTVGNQGYLGLLLNLYYTLQQTTPIRTRNFVILTPDPKLKHALKTWPCIKVFYIDYKPWYSDSISSAAVAFKRDDWNAITRFKLLAIWAVLQSGRAVFYVDPDIAFIKNPAPYLTMNSAAVYIQEGGPFCTGVICAHPSSASATALFNPLQWKDCGLDDESYVNNSVNSEVSVKALDWKLFPNGKMWRDDPRNGVNLAKQSIQNKDCVLFHFNHIAGIEAKISRMQELDCYHQIMRVANVPAQFRPSLARVCVERSGSTYPPHHQGDHLEEACDRLVTSELRERLIASPYTYLPIHWTAIAVAKNPQLLTELVEWCQRFFVMHPKELFWTVVQHCKGIYGSCGVGLPASRVKLFMTSDPNGALQSSIVVNHRVITKPLPLAKTSKAQAKTPAQRQKYRHLQTVNATPPAPPALRVNTESKPISLSEVTVPLVSAEHGGNRGVAQRDLLASFIGNIGIHPIRQQLQSALQGQPDIVVTSGAHNHEADAKAFCKLMQRSVFALCPRGFGTTSFRLTEAMEFGCIPVYISDTFSIPFEEKLDINDVCILVRPHEIPHLAQRLRAISTSEIERMRANIARLREKYFTLDGCCRTILECVTGTFL